MQIKELTSHKKLIKLFCVVMLLSVTIIWGYGIIVTDDVLMDMPVFSLLAGRFLLAGIVLFIVRLCFIRTKIYPKFTKLEVLSGIIIGIINFAGFYFQSVGLLYTNTAKSGMLTSAYVIIVPLIYCIIRKKFQIKPIVNAIIFLIGLFILFDLRKFGGNFNKGDFLTLLCAICFAIQLIMVDRIADRISSINFTSVHMFTMGVLGLIGMLTKEHSLISTVDWKSGIPAILYLGILSSAYAYLAQTFAQAKLSPSLAAIILSLESLFGIIFSLIFGKVDWTWYLGVGSLIMLSATLSATLADIKTDNEKNGGEKEG